MAPETPELDWCPACPCGWNGAHPSTHEGRMREEAEMRAARETSEATREQPAPARSKSSLRDLIEREEDDEPPHLSWVIR